MTGKIRMPLAAFAGYFLPRAGRCWRWRDFDTIRIGGRMRVLGRVPGPGAPGAAPYSRFNDLLTT